MNAHVRLHHESRFQPGLLLRLPPVKKVALLRASRIGDFICATPAFRALREALPDSEITLIGLPLVRDLVARNSAIDRFAAFPGWPGIAEQFYRPQRAKRALAWLRAQEFDLAIQMHGSGVFSNPFTRAIRARACAGFVRPGDNGAGLDAALVMPGGNERERLLDLVRFLGAGVSRGALEFPLTPADHREAASLLRDIPTPLIGVHPDARDEARRWPLESYLAVAGRIAAARQGTVVVIGGDSGEPIAGVVDLRGRTTTLPVLGAVIARLAVLLTNDSGPAHVAYALGTPSVTVFGGATDPAQWGPPPGPHEVVSAGGPVGPTCIADVSVESVYTAVLRAMSSSRRSHGRSHGR